MIPLRGKEPHPCRCTHALVHTRWMQRQIHVTMYTQRLRGRTDCIQASGRGRAGKGKSHDGIRGEIVDFQHRSAGFVLRPFLVRCTNSTTRSIPLLKRSSEEDLPWNRRSKENQSTTLLLRCTENRKLFEAIRRRSARCSWQREIPRSSIVSLRCPRGIIYRLVTPRENRTAEQKLRGYPVEIGTTTRSRAVYTVPACRRTAPSTARVIKPVSQTTGADYLAIQIIPRASSISGSVCPCPYTVHDAGSIFVTLVTERVFACAGVVRTTYARTENETHARTRCTPVNVTCTGV